MSDIDTALEPLGEYASPVTLGSKDVSSRRSRSYPFCQPPASWSTFTWWSSWVRTRGSDSASGWCLVGHVTWGLVRLALFGCGYGNALSPFLQLNVLFISFLMTSSQRLLSQCFQIYTFSLFFFPFVFFSVVLRTQPRPQTCYPRPLSLSHVPSPSDASFHLSPCNPGVHIDSVFYNSWMRKWSP